MYFPLKWLLKKKKSNLKRRENCRNVREKGKPKNSDVPDSVAGILTASDQTDWHRIKYFEKNVSSSVETNAMNRQSSTDAAAY